MSSTHIVIANELGQVNVAGPNTNGQLSIGSTTQTNTFTLARLDASTNLTSVLQAVDGSAHSLFLRSTGLVYAAGLNANGQLGLGTTADMSFAALVQQSVGVDLSNVVSVAAGGAHSVFLLRDGSALACGLNTSGQLGDGTLIQRSFPVPIYIVLDVSLNYTLLAYYKFDGFLRNEVTGNVLPGGTYTTNNVKIGTHSITTNTYTAIGIEDITKTANTSMSVCFWIYYTGSAAGDTTNQWFWVGQIVNGSDYRGTRMNGTTLQFLASGITVFHTLKSNFPTNEWHHIAIVGSSTAGQTYLYYDASLTNTISGNTFSISSLTNQTLFGFSGTGIYGNIDDMRFYNAALTQSDIQYLFQTTSPIYSQITLASSISAGDYHTLLSRSDGSIYSCGLNNNGQLGIGTLVNTNYASQVKTNISTNLTGVTQVAAGGSHSLALTTANNVYSWGSNAAGQLSLGTTVDSSFATLCLSAAETTLSNVVQVAAGAAHSLFLTTSGTVFACGSNSAGQLADGTTTNRSYPVQVLTATNQPLTQIAAIHATVNQSYFLARDGIVYAAGFNGTGAFGNGTTTNSSFAIAVLTPAASGFKAMGYSASYARKRGATVANLITAGYTTLEIVCAGYTKAELVAGGLTPTAMRNAGVTYKQLVFAGYTDSELTAIGYNFPSIVPLSLDGSPLAVNTEVLYAANLFTSSSVTISGQTPTYRNGQYTISESSFDISYRMGYTAFNLSTAVGVIFWADGTGQYNAATGNYTGSNATTGIRGSSDISGEWIQIRMPYRLLLRQIGIMSRRDGSSDRLPYSFVIVGSNDGTNWNILYQQLQPPTEYTPAVLNTIPVTSATSAYSYLRLIARGTKPNGSSNNQINMQQLNFNGDIYPIVDPVLGVGVNTWYAANIFSSNTQVVSGQTPSYRNGTYVASASTVHSAGLDVFYAFNLGTNPYWHATNSTVYDAGGVYTGGVSTSGISGSSNILGEWIQIRFPYRLVLKSFALMSRSGFVGRLPSSLVILGSTDGTTWYIVYQQTAPPTAYVDSPALNTITVSGVTIPYSYMRLIARTMGGSGSPNIAQLNFNGDIYSL